MIVLVVIVGFPPFGPPRENGGCTFRPDAFLSPLAGYFFTFFIKIIENHQNCVFSNLFDPWQETFADAGDVDGGEGAFGTIWHHFRTILEQF